MNKENVDILLTKMKLSSENDDIFRQTKLNQTKLYSEEEDKRDASFEIPGYAYNQATHNFNGLIESLDRYKVTNPEEKQRFSGSRIMAEKARRYGDYFPIPAGARLAHRGSISLPH